MTAPTVYHLPVLLELMAHRPPILLLDRIEVASDSCAVTGFKTITIDEPCYHATEPTDAFGYPRALVLESFGQSAAALWLHREEASSKDTRTLYFGRAEGIRFAGDAKPGDTMVHHVRMIRGTRRTLVVSGRTLIDGVAIMTVDLNIAVAR